jgi:MFS family permease
MGGEVRSLKEKLFSSCLSSSSTPFPTETTTGTSDNNENKSRGRTAEFWGLVVVTLAVFVDVVAYGVIFPLLPLYGNNYNLSEWELSFLVSAFAFGALPSQPFFGYLSDAESGGGGGGSDRKKVMMMLGLGVMFGTTLLYSVANRYFWLVVARVLQGVASACTWSAGLSALAQVYPSERLGFAMGVVQFVNSLGALMGAPLGGWMYHLGGYTAPFIAIAILCFIDGLGRLLLLDSNNNKKNHNQYNKKDTSRDPELALSSSSSSSASSASSASSSSSSSSSSMTSQLWNALGTINGALWLVFVGQGLQGLIVEYLNIVLPLSLDSLFSLSPKDIGTLLGLMSLGNALAAGASGYVSDRWASKSQVLLIGVLMLAISIPLLAYPFIVHGNHHLLPLPSSPAVGSGSPLIANVSVWDSAGAGSLVVTFFVLGSALGIFPALALVGSIIEQAELSDHSGFIYGVCTSSYTLGMLLGPLFAGLVMTTSSSPSPPATTTSPPHLSFAFDPETVTSQQLRLMFLPAGIVFVFAIVYWRAFPRLMARIDAKKGRAY